MKKGWRFGGIPHRNRRRRLLQRTATDAMWRSHSETRRRLSLSPLLNDHLLPGLQRSQSSVQPALLPTKNCSATTGTPDATSPLRIRSSCTSWASLFQKGCRPSRLLRDSPLLETHFSSYLQFGVHFPLTTRRVTLDPRSFFFLASSQPCALWPAPSGFVLNQRICSPRER